MEIMVAENMGAGTAATDPNVVRTRTLDTSVDKMLLLFDLKGALIQEGLV